MVMIPSRRYLPPVLPQISLFYIAQVKTRINFTQYTSVRDGEIKNSRSTTGSQLPLTSSTEWAATQVCLKWSIMIHSQLWKECLQLSTFNSGNLKKRKPGKDGSVSLLFRLGWWRSTSRRLIAHISENFLTRKFSRGMSSDADGREQQTERGTGCAHLVTPATV